VMIPNAAMLEKDPQIALRIKIAVAGLALGAGLLVLAALGTRPRRSLRPSTLWSTPPSTSALRPTERAARRRR
jgi:hypothetical protein